MQIANGQGSIRGFEDIIDRLRGKGVTLWVEKGALKYRAPKGVLTAEDRHALTRATCATSLLPDGYPRPRNAGSVSLATYRAPLSFTQLEHWSDRRRYGGRPARHIASAIRMRGPLRVKELSESLLEIGLRHDALRTRIVCEGTVPLQEISQMYLPELEVIELSSVSESRRGLELEGQIQRAILDAEDYAKSPLFKAVLVSISETEHVLILALDHMISDLASLQLLRRELFTAYAQLLRERPIDLPRIAMQFPAYASRLRDLSPHTLSRACDRFRSAPRTRFPRAREARLMNKQTDWGSVEFTISRELREELRAWVRTHGTTKVIVMLTVYSALVLRWCGVNETLILFMTDGRMGAEIEHTAGYFAFLLYVKAAIDDETTTIDLLRRVTEEYCSACDEADFGYAFAQVPRPEFTRNASFNWFPSEAAGGHFRTSSPDLGLTCSTVELPSPLAHLLPADQEPLLSFAEKGGEIIGRISYSRTRLSDLDMERFAHNVPNLLIAMLRNSTCRIKDIPVV
jgi:hypothetical protein